MAMTKCKECSREISRSAKTCPHCGVGNPGKNIGCLKGGCILLFACGLIAVVVTLIIPRSGGPRSQAPVASGKTQQTVTRVASVPKWAFTTSTDEMDGATRYFAQSPASEPTEAMDFPYHDIEAWLGVGVSEADEWTYIGFSGEPNIAGAETHDGYDSFVARVRWDDKMETMTMIHEWGSKFIGFKDDPRAIAKMMAASKVLVEISWYGEGQVHFEFSLAGSSSAVAKARAKGAG